MIAVLERRETPGFAAWSTKGGVPHVRPPLQVLESMVALRLDLDGATETNGPLQVIPETHARGILDAGQIQSIRRSQPPVVCLVPPAGGLLMRPPQLCNRTSAMARALSKTPEGYEDLLRDLKQRVRAARTQAALAVNRELVLLYWSIGRNILDRQERLGWGAKVVDLLAADLNQEFPEVRGFSGRNLKYMRSFAQAWPDQAIVQGPLAQITWWHNLALLQKVKNPEQRLWYARKTSEAPLRSAEPPSAEQVAKAMDAKVAELRQAIKKQPSMSTEQAIEAAAAGLTLMLLPNAKMVVEGRDKSATKEAACRNRLRELLEAGPRDGK